MFQIHTSNVLSKNDKVEGDLTISVDNDILTKNFVSNKETNFTRVDLLPLASLFIEINFNILNNNKNLLFTIDSEIFKDYPKMSFILGAEDVIISSKRNNIFLCEGEWKINYDEFYNVTENFIDLVLSKYEIL